MTKSEIGETAIELLRAQLRAGAIDRRRHPETFKLAQRLSLAWRLCEIDDLRMAQAETAGLMQRVRGEVWATRRICTA